MIRWCCYCQAFLGEVAPFDRASFTHGMCTSCDERFDREPLHVQTAPARELVGRLLASAATRDLAACERIVVEARELGLKGESLLVGMLQPALYEAGRAWEQGRMSVEAEHRLTSWCEQVFHRLPLPERASSLDLLILQAPGNTHTLGPRFAARILAERGVSVEAVIPELPLEEIVALARALRPRAIGFSCALPAAVPATRQLVAAVRARLEPDLVCRYVVSGFAFRAHEIPASSVDATVIADLAAVKVALAS